MLRGRVRSARRRSGARSAAPYDAALALAGRRATRTRCGVRSSELQRLDARATAAIVARRLRERGARGLPRGPRPSTKSNPAGLTPREVEVLALVAGGPAELARSPSGSSCR